MTVSDGPAVAILTKGDVSLRSIFIGTFTRPNDTTPYASGDVVANATSRPTALQFSCSGRSSLGSGVLYGVSRDDQNNPNTPGEFELWLFSASTTVGNDNANANVSWNNLANLIAVIQLTSSTLTNSGSGNAGSRRYQSSSPLGIPFVTDASGNLYGALVSKSAYTPIALEIFRFYLKTEMSW